jgi:tRNA 2-selenouridine synthase
MAQILSEVGWRVGLIEGGYRTYRRRVVATLYDTPLPFRMLVIAGGTGSGKTDLLERLGDLGVQTLDLEALAHHRGSLFGGRAGDPQPSQKMFESRLASALQGMSPERFVVVEDESSRIGDLFIPSALWAAMAAGPRLEIRATAQARARHVVRRYPDLLGDVAQARAAIDALPRHHARETKAHWRALLEAQDFEALACELIERHYDPAYGRRDGAMSPWPTIDVGDLSDFCLAAAAVRVADIVRSAEAGSFDQHLHEDWRPQ